MAKYRAKADLLVDENPGRSPGPILIKSGTEFTSSRVPGENWEPLDAAAKVAKRNRFGGAAAADTDVEAEPKAPKKKPVTAREKAAARKEAKEAKADAAAAEAAIAADAEAAADTDADLKL